MKLTVAIHPDDYTAPNMPAGSDASSARWAASLGASGFTVRWVDVRRADILEQLAGCHGFMWRWGHFGGMGRIARSLLPVIERELAIPVYPDHNTCWHYDDKIAQAYLLKALNIPAPKTWIWFDRQLAEQWALHATYPLVLKLAVGASSENVKLVRDAPEAKTWIDRLFAYYIFKLDEEQFSSPPISVRLRKAASVVRRGARPFTAEGREANTGYALFQEFLPGNKYDTRVTVIGDRAFAFRRFNRPDDFRASGSGRFDLDPAKIDEKFVRLAFSTARKLKSQSCAIDGLYRGRDHVVGEVSYTYVSSAVNACPGHWILDGDVQSGELKWVPGQMWPEEAQVKDFIAKLVQRAGS